MVTHSCSERVSHVKYVPILFPPPRSTPLNKEHQGVSSHGENFHRTRSGTCSGRGREMQDVISSSPLLSHHTTLKFEQRASRDVQDSHGENLSPFSEEQDPALYISLPLYPPLSPSFIHSPSPFPLYPPFFRDIGSRTISARTSQRTTP